MELEKSIEEKIALLVAHPLVGRASHEEHAWLAAHATYEEHALGSVVGRREEEIPGLIIVLTGLMAFHMDRGPNMRTTIEWHAGELSGLLPYSRMVKPPGETIVEQDTHVLRIHRSFFPEMIRECPQVTAMCVHAMLDRARQFTSSDLHDEKMMSLGKLASGLAHELNNPASAAARSAKLLSRELDDAYAATRALAAAGLSAEQFLVLDDVRAACAVGPVAARSPLEEADREDAIAAWLRAHGADADAAEALARTAVTIDGLDRLAAAMHGAALDAALRWIGTGCALRELSGEIETATARIHHLVTAVKGFTYMDRASVAEYIDVARGLADTVAVLEGKARDKAVRVTIDTARDLPRVHGFGSEINQIWEKLIDNAIDAVDEQGEVTITASHDAGTLIVRVIDNGPGIPQEFMGRIFDPFFTTKPLGQGTGLGLDIVQRLVRWHGGEIVVNSKPGRTVFRVNLPVGGK